MTPPPRSPDSVREEIARVVADELGWEGPLPDGPLDEHLDSVDRLTLVVAVEDHFEVALGAEDDDSVITLDDLVALLLKKLAP